MNAVAGFRCVDCGEALGSQADPRRCPACGGVLLPSYDVDAVDPEPAADTAAGFLERTGLEGLLGVAATDRPVLGAGETPLLDAEKLAHDLGVGRLSLKNEGQNPTGSIADREAAVAVGGAVAACAETVALPTMGNAGQAVAAAAARAGLDSESFVPSRTPFVNKAMINVHGGEMTVVEGRYRDAVAAYEAAVAETDRYPLAPFATPFRLEGIKPLAYELAAARDWTAPDRVIVPTGHVTALVGIDRGFRDLLEAGLIDRRPALVAAQAAGCAPLADGIATDADSPAAVEYPDTVVGPLEIPDPAGGELALSAIRESGGTAVGVEDPDILAGAQTLAEAGLPTGVTGGAALAAARALADEERLGAEADVVLVNPIAGSKEADIMRSHLMSQGR